MMPTIITSYLQAAADHDSDSLAACFAPDGVVTDEGASHHGRDEIRRWHEGTLTTFTYTVTVIGTEQTAPGEYRVSTHLEGDFPGGEVDLSYDFKLRDELISELVIG
jgi:uncharacterized protein (TIGR02246 family)